MTEAVLQAERAAGGWTSFRLRGGPDVAAQARAAIRSLVPALDDAEGDVELIVSELVTNAYRHAGTPELPIEVDLSVDGSLVRGEVTDSGPGFTAAPVPADRRGVGGWGLHIVESLSDRWGVRAGPPSSVWFELRR